MAYCRAARRLRGRHARQPAKLHNALCELSRRQDAARPAPAGFAPVAGTRCDAFAMEVVNLLEGPTLRHSQRRALLATAHRLGIGRFEANLVIAAVQHRHIAEAPAGEVGSATSRVSRLGPFALIVAVQSCIVLWAWLILWA